MVLLLCFAGCASGEPTLTPAPNGTLRIVSSLPSKGVSAALAISRAIDLALDEHSSTVSRWHVEHLQLDDAQEETGDWSREREQSNATAAASDPSVVAYIGANSSGATGIALPITNRAHLLQLGPSATWPGLTLDGWNTGEPGQYYPNGDRTYARLMPPDSAQALAAARWLTDLGGKTPYVISDGSTYSEGLAMAFVARCEALGMHVAGRSSLADLTALPIDRINSTHADALFYAPSTIGQAVAAARRLGNVTLPYGVLASDTVLSDQFLEQGGPTRQTWRVVFNGRVVEPISETWHGFSANFRSRYGIAPTQFAGNAYDLTNLVLDAIAATGSADRQQIARKVLGTANYPGASGLISFDAKGDVQRWEMSGYKLVEGKFIFDRELHSEP